MEYPSKLVENAIHEISRLPGIGKKTAMRMVMHLIKEDETISLALADAIQKLRTGIKFCTTCHNICDGDRCNLCVSHRRNDKVVCVVEESKDVMAVENTSQFNGLYHVLGGVISPIQGVSPEHLNIGSLIKRVEAGLEEVILALPTTMEGDTTAFYIHRKLQHLPVKVTSIARGIPVGGELEYADEITLGRSITYRIDFDMGKPREGN